MISTCPNCKTQIEHEEYLFEVGCTCGMRFNPFFDPNQLAGNDPSNSRVGFAESTNAFKDIVDFGEGLGKENTPTPVPAPGSENGRPERSITDKREKTKTKSLPDIPVVPHETGGERLLAASDHLEGYAIESYFFPVSLWATLEDGQDPLHGAFETLFTQATAVGANALVSVKWQMASDSTRVLISGIPVVCRKN